MYGYVWLCRAMYGYVWLCTAMYVYVWLCHILTNGEPLYDAYTTFLPSNRLSAEQYYLTVSRAKVSTHQGRIFLKLSADNLLVSNDRRLRFFQIHIKYVVFMSLSPSTNI